MELSPYKDCCFCRDNDRAEPLTSPTLKGLSSLQEVATRRGDAVSKSVWIIQYAIKWIYVTKMRCHKYCGLIGLFSSWKVVLTLTQKHGTRLAYHRRCYLQYQRKRAGDDNKENQSPGTDPQTPFRTPGKWRWIALFHILIVILYWFYDYCKNVERFSVLYPIGVVLFFWWILINLKWHSQTVELELIPYVTSKLKTFNMFVGLVRPSPMRLAKLCDMRLRYLSFL